MTLISSDSHARLIAERRALAEIELAAGNNDRWETGLLEVKQTNALDARMSAYGTFQPNRR